MKDTSHTKLLPYQQSWKKSFRVEKEKLKSIFGDKALEIEHIGSTSVPGLASKPIIDIAVLIEDRADADVFIKDLEGIGYRHDEDALSTERHFFRKGSPTEFHLSIAYTNQGGFWERQILFRDYLRSHPDARDEYAELKKELLAKDPSGKSDYISRKTEFVEKILKNARR